MIPEASLDVMMVDTQAGLESLVARLESQPWVAMDTEFMRERTYYAQLCLIQLATPSLIACVDPLADLDMTALNPLLENPGITKVFHAAFQDIEVLLQTCGSLPAPVFDTQVAATLVGRPDQMGYARLVQDMLGVELEKTHTRTDWSRRPLDADEVSYAADDVRYLAQLYPLLVDELTRRGRLEWLAPEFQALVDPARYVTEPADAWARIKAWKRLKPGQIAVLKSLAAWREEAARDADRPRGWILKDDVLADIARRRPRDLPGLAAIRGLPEATVRKHGDHLLTLIREARDAPPQPAPEAPVRLGGEQQAMVDLLMAGLRLRAADIDISPSALANRSDLERLVDGDSDVPLLQGWRHQAAGRLVQALQSGRARLVVEQGALRLEDSS